MRLLDDAKFDSMFNSVSRLFYHLVHKWFALRDYIEKAATKRPNVSLITQEIALIGLEDLWGSVVQMSGKALGLAQLLKVVRHTNHTPLD